MSPNFGQLTEILTMTTQTKSKIVKSRRKGKPRRARRRTKEDKQSLQNVSTRLKKKILTYRHRRDEKRKYKRFYLAKHIFVKMSLVVFAYLAMVCVYVWLLTPPMFSIVENISFVSNSVSTVIVLAYILLFKK